MNNPNGNPGFTLLRDVFSKFAARQSGAMLNPKDMGRSIAKEMAILALDNDFKVNKDDLKIAGARAVYKQMPRNVVENLVQDLRDTLVSQDMVDGLSMAAQSLDLSKALEASQKFTDTLKNPQVLQGVATFIKTSSATMNNFSEFRLTFKTMFAVEKMPATAAQVFDVVMDNLEEVFDAAKDNGAGVPEISDMLSAKLDAVPFDQVFQMAFGAAQFVTPDMVKANVAKQVDALPTAKDAGDQYDALYTQLTGQLPPKVASNTNNKPKPAKKPNKGKGGFKF